jgi:hypothetical protein
MTSLVSSRVRVPTGVYQAEGLGDTFAAEIIGQGGRFHRRFNGPFRFREALNHPPVAVGRINDPCESMASNFKSRESRASRRIARRVPRGLVPLGLTRLAVPARTEPWLAYR